MNILGITAPLSWNQACAIVVNGNLVAVAEEERFNRMKHSPRIPPYRATEFCLSQSKIHPNEIDYLAIGYRSPMIAYLLSTIENIKNRDFERIVREAGAFAEYFIGLVRYKEWLQKIGVDFSKTKLSFIPHHLAHAASAYRSSGMTNANILTLDGQGEDDAGMLGFGTNGVIHPLAKIGHHQGLGWVYSETTDLLGFKSHSDEGKVMGLSAFGKKSYKKNPWHVENISYQLFHNWNTQFWRQYGPRRYSHEPLTAKHKILARTTQNFVEQAASALVRKLYSLSQCNNLVLAGGVGLNCDMNAKIASLPFIKNLFVYPAADDAGTAVGAALEVAAKLGEKADYEMKDTYLGPAYSNSEIEKSLKEAKVPHKRYKSTDEIATLLVQGKIIGWFQGRMEFGPRALGNRSILAHPNLYGMKEKINANVKHRETWRPFAPTILDEDGPRLFKNYFYSPFMTVTFHTTSYGEKLLSQTIHVDHTSRIQSIKKNDNQKLYSLWKAFKKQTSIPGVLNTSLNDDGEPIVCSPKDALRTFFATGLDYIILEDYIVCK
ncbi:hypothetical protein HYW55_04720 [Candidatus Gottesmanbacteria bacterium]|nr:hypothetical protein [Candidatus Gottesmanbacteria bacterium]